jgi:hypothetical protein
MEPVSFSTLFVIYHWRSLTTVFRTLCVRHILGGFVQRSAIPLKNSGMQKGAQKKSMAGKPSVRLRFEISKCYNYLFSMDIKLGPKRDA